jgi:hypothetical protein
MSAAVRHGGPEARPQKDDEDLGPFRGEELKRTIVQRVIADVPELLSVDLLEIFASLATR